MRRTITVPWHFPVGDTPLPIRASVLDDTVSVLLVAGVTQRLKCWCQRRTNTQISVPCCPSKKLDREQIVVYQCLNHQLGLHSALHLLDIQQDSLDFC